MSKVRQRLEALNKLRSTVGRAVPRNSLRGFPINNQSRTYQNSGFIPITKQRDVQIKSSDRQRHSHKPLSRTDLYKSQLACGNGQFYTSVNNPKRSYICGDYRVINGTKLAEFPQLNGKRDTRVKIKAKECEGYLNQSLERYQCLDITSASSEVKQFRNRLNNQVGIFNKSTRLTVSDLIIRPGCRPLHGRSAVHRKTVRFLKPETGDKNTESKPESFGKLKQLLKIAHRSADESTVDEY